MLIQSEFVDLNTPTGIMRTYVHKPVTHKKTPAILFYSEIFQQTGPIERAAKIIAGHGFTVLVGTRCPAVLVECGFISNPRERGRCATRWYQQTAARAIYDGLMACR